MGQIWLVNVFVELLKAIDETETAMIYDEKINLEKIREIFKLKLPKVLRNRNNMLAINVYYN